ncbi:hypothetical protein HV824_08735 [Myxococcus sp. AM009]|uniref:hypothetical protein n=1 Tax=Myxococcus sp. AM009 TaxID=2745137 RepID=UPI0015957D0D|nr:hypothetical protein [Myxococcus sp. AM009]NVI98209.1 hypothetical protein [Myxococcus sp. AM009]
MRFETAVWCLGILVLACGPEQDGPPCDAACVPEDTVCRARACASALPGEALRTAADCVSMPVGGRCLGTRIVERCVEGVHLQEDCGANEACVLEGGAHCAAGAACLDGGSRCSADGVWQACVQGQWRARACAAGCVETEGRGWCGAPGPTLSGTVRYARRFPDADFTGWSAEAEWVPAGGFLVASYQGATLMDFQVSGLDGRFSVRVAAQPREEDRIVVYAAGLGSAARVACAVADPGQRGAREVTEVPGSAARIWSWSQSTRAVAGQGVFSIAEADGSGAASVFSALRAAWHESRGRYGRAGLPVVVWLGFGTTWSCGACFAPWPVTAAGRTWGAQVWLPGDGDAAWWSEAMVLHELGHWVMASHGTSPNEGGPHYLGVPTFPGQAWSEGWATWFSADVRGSPRYFDRQGGTMFWMDLEARRPATGAWTRPRPEAGLLQKLEVSEVAAILYRLGKGTSSRQPMYEALAAPGMNAAPWRRGYQRHQWRVEAGQLVDVARTDIPAPCLADFLDTMMCQGFPRWVMDAATEPESAYPYLSHSPLCQ